jgi:hypothetical protein
VCSTCIAPSETGILCKPAQCRHLVSSSLLLFMPTTKLYSPKQNCRGTFRVRSCSRSHRRLSDEGGCACGVGRAVRSREAEVGIYIASPSLASPNYTGLVYRSNELTIFLEHAVEIGLKGVGRPSGCLASTLSTCLSSTHRVAVDSNRPSVKPSNIEVADEFGSSKQQIIT